MKILISEITTLPEIFQSRINPANMMKSDAPFITNILPAAKYDFFVCPKLIKKNSSNVTSSHPIKNKNILFANTTVNANA